MKEPLTFLQVAPFWQGFCAPHSLKSENKQQKVNIKIYKTGLFACKFGSKGLSSGNEEVICGAINIVVVLPMSTSWLEAYAAASGFSPDLRQYASRMSCPCGLTVVYEISPSSRYCLYWVESTINQELKKKKSSCNEIHSPCSHLSPIQLSGHLQENDPRLLIQVPPFIHTATPPTVHSLKS